MHFNSIIHCRSPSKRYARRTVGGITRDVIMEERNVIDGYRNAPSKPPRMLNSHSMGNMGIRVYESFNSSSSSSSKKVGNDIAPKKAWSDGKLSDE